jgi:hypothetical protein
VGGPGSPAEGVPQEPEDLRPRGLGLRRGTRYVELGPLTFRQAKLIAAEDPDLLIVARYPADPSTRRALEDAATGR